MTGILDYLEKSQPQAGGEFYRPATPEHFLALRLAQRLNDVAAIQHYAAVCDQHPFELVLAAYRVATQQQIQNRAAAFHAALERIRRADTVPASDLAAVRIERRAVAVAIFHGTSLKYPPIARQLSSDPIKAVASAALFINRLRDKCAFTSAVLERLPDGCEVHRSQLAKVVIHVFKQRQVAIHQFAKPDVLAAFGHPPLRFRSAVRDVMSAMWPELNGGFGSPLIRDALALGLYCQTEHLLSTE